MLIRRNEQCNYSGNVQFNECSIKSLTEIFNPWKCNSINTAITLTDIDNDKSVNVLSVTDAENSHSSNQFKINELEHSVFYVCYLRVYFLFIYSPINCQYMKIVVIYFVSMSVNRIESTKLETFLTRQRFHQNRHQITQKKEISNWINQIQ